MDNERIKVYVGRRSMCAGDDMKAPNMKSFYLPDNLDEFAAKLDRILPFDGRTCYSGYAIKNVKGEEDGIVVGGKNDSRVVISVSDKSDTDAGSEKHLLISEYAENWHDLITASPYLFCE